MEQLQYRGIEFYCLCYKPEVTHFQVECLEGMTERAVCGLCFGPIADRYIMQVTDTTYHERCLICSACGIPLAGTCFARESKLYCRIDYDRLFAKRCLGCSERICPGEMVMRTHSDGAQLFHLRCFQCVVCGAQLQKGDQFVVKQGQLFCRPDYEKELEMFRSIPQGCEDLSGEETCGRKDGRKGPKRPRTILTTQQRRAFKASFEISPKPCRKVREGLAKDTGLSVRIVQVWFQNQRAKMKKMQKKGKLDPKNTNEIKELDADVKTEKLKEEDHSSQGSVYSNYMGAEGRYSSQEESPETAFYRNILTAHQQPFNNNPEGETGWKMEGIGGNLIHQQMSQLPSNPIDRLYSMQNSYFCPEDEQPLAYASS